jgi:hypothetical protein
LLRLLMLAAVASTSGNPVSRRPKLPTRKIMR